MWQSMHRFILVQLSWPGVLLNFYASFELKINSCKQVTIQMENLYQMEQMEHRSPFSWLFLIWGEQGLFVSASSVLNHVWIKSSFRFTYWYRAKEGNYILQSIRFRDWLSFFSFDSAVQKALMRSHDNFSDLTEGKEHTRMLN